MMRLAGKIGVQTLLAQRIGEEQILLLEAAAFVVARRLVADQIDPVMTLRILRVRSRSNHVCDSKQSSHSRSR